MPTNIDRVLDFVRSRAPDGVTNSEIVRATGIRPHQQVFQITQKLVERGFLISERRGRERVFHLSEETRTPKNDTLPATERTSAPPIATGVETTSEDEIRDTIMSLLYYRIGQEDSWEGEGKTARFKLKGEYGETKCFAEEILEYDLPNGDSLSHKNDILFVSAGDERAFISIEIKHRSAVTDQFKCRSYDMLHLKNTFEQRLLGIMLYVKAKGGLTTEQARLICYPFDRFLSVPAESRHVPSAWDELIETVTRYLGSEDRK